MISIKMRMATAPPTTPPAIAAVLEEEDEPLEFGELVGKTSWVERMVCVVV